MSSQKSTIGRFIKSAQLTAIRAAFGTLERLAPELGTRWATNLWLTVPPFRAAPDRTSHPASPSPSP